MIELIRRPDDLWTWRYVENSQEFWCSKSFSSAQDAIASAERSYPQAKVPQSTISELPDDASRPPAPDPKPERPNNRSGGWLLLLAALRLLRQSKQRKRPS